MSMLPQGAAEGTQKTRQRAPRAPKISQESPKKHRGATKSTRSEAKRAPNNTKKGAKRATESPKAKCVQIILDDGHEDRAPADARVRFRCQRRGDRRTSFRLIFGPRMGPWEIPWGVRSVQKTLAMIKSICFETISCFSSRLVSVKPHRTGR